MRKRKAPMGVQEGKEPREEGGDFRPSVRKKESRVRVLLGGLSAKYTITESSTYAGERPTEKGTFGIVPSMYFSWTPPGFDTRNVGL